MIFRFTGLKARRANPESRTVVYGRKPTRAGAVPSKHIIKTQEGVEEKKPDAPPLDSKKK